MPTPKCPLCKGPKARRRCHRSEDQDICSKCCASLRGPECGDCPHYGENIAYEQRRKHEDSDKPQVLFELNDEVNDQVNALLEEAQRSRKRVGFLLELEALRRKHPLVPGVHFGIGLIHAMDDHQEEALRHFDEALRLNPYLTEALYNKGCCQAQLADVAGAVRSFRRVLELGTPGESEVDLAKAELRRIVHIVQKTEGTDIETYLRGQDAFASAYALMQEKRWAAAEAGFRESLRYGPKAVACHGNLGICVSMQGRQAEALDWYDKALAIDPGYELARNNRQSALHTPEGQIPKVSTFLDVKYSLEKVRLEKGPHS